MLRRRDGRTAIMCTPAGTWPRPSRGITATPRPAATRASWVAYSLAVCAMRGSRSAERSVNVSQSWQEVPGVPQIHGPGPSWSRSTARSPCSLACRASGWVSGTAMSARSSSSRVRVSPSGADSGAFDQSCAMTRSTAPWTRAGTDSLESASVSSTCSAGCAAARRPSAGAASPRVAVGRQASTSRPATAPAWASTSAWASSAMARIALACPASSSAESVSRMPRPLRSTSVVPDSRSSRASCWETAEVVTCSSAAAAVTDPCRATACRTRRRSRFNTLVTLRHDRQNN